MIFPITLFVRGLLFGLAIVFCFFCSRGGIFIIWLRLELFIWGMLPFFFYKKKASNREILLKFFICQSLSALIWANRIILLISTPSIRNWGRFQWIIIFSIFLKMGIFPFRGWLLEILYKGDIFLIFLLLGFQKIIPVLIISKWGSFIRRGAFKILFFANFFFIIWGFLNHSNLIFYLFFSRLYHIIIFFIFVETLGRRMSPPIYFSYYLLFFLLFRFYAYRTKRRLFFTHPLHSKEWGFFIFYLSLRGLPPYAMFFVKIFFLLKITSIWGNILLLILIPLIFVYLFRFLWILFVNRNSASPVKFLFSLHLLDYHQEEQEFLLVLVWLSLLLLGGRLF